MRAETSSSQNLQEGELIFSLDKAYELAALHIATIMSKIIRSKIFVRRSGRSWCRQSTYDKETRQTVGTHLGYMSLFFGQYFLSMSNKERFLKEYLKQVYTVE